MYLFCTRRQPAYGVSDSLSGFLYVLQGLCLCTFYCTRRQPAHGVFDSLSGFLYVLQGLGLCTFYCTRRQPTSGVSDTLSGFLYVLRGLGLACAINLISAILHKSRLSAKYKAKKMLLITLPVIDNGLIAKFFW